MTPESSQTSEQHPRGAHKQATEPKQSIAELADELRTTVRTHQQQLYTASSKRGSWKACYTALDELAHISRSYPISNLELQREVWKQISAPEFERFQRIFCHPDDLVVPTDIRKTAQTRLPVIPTSHAAPALFSVMGCIVDPARIPESVATKLGIIPDEKRTRKETLEALSSPAAITLLKFYWDCSRPLGTRARNRPNQSIRVILPPTEYIAKTYAPLFKRLGIKPSPDQIGAILCTREAQPGAKIAPGHVMKPLTVQYFRTAYDAHRKTYQEERRYSAELPALIELMDRWNEFHKNELPRWTSRDKLAEELRRVPREEAREAKRSDILTNNEVIVAAYRVLLDDSIEFFKGAVHAQKRATHDRLVAMREKLDASPTGRLNPVHVDLQVEANNALKELRLEDIRVKDSFNRNDQKLLDTVLPEHTGVFRSLHKALLTNAGLLEQHEALFRNGALRTYQRPRAINALKESLQLGLRRLDSTRVKPFVALSTALKSAERTFDAALLRGNRAEAKEALSEMFFITRVFHLNNAAELIKLSLAEASFPVIERLDQAQQHLYRAVGAGLAAARAATAGPAGRQTTFSEPTSLERAALGERLNVVTRNFLSTLRSVQTEVLELKRKELTENRGLPLEEEREALAQHITERLESFDLLQLLAALPQRR